MLELWTHNLSGLRALPMLNHSDIPESIQNNIKHFHSKNLLKLGVQKYLFSSLYLHCMRKEGKADGSIPYLSWTVVSDVLPAY